MLPWRQPSPAWSDWDRWKFERQCRAGRSVDQAPSQSGGARPVSWTNAFWGRMVVQDLGHQVADVFLRILARLRCSDDGRMIISVRSWHRAAQSSGTLRPAPLDRRGRTIEPILTTCTHLVHGPRPHGHISFADGITIPDVPELIYAFGSTGTDLRQHFGARTFARAIPDDLMDWLAIQTVPRSTRNIGLATAIAPKVPE